MKKEIKKSDLEVGMTVIIENRECKVLKNVKTIFFGIQEVLFATLPSQTMGFFCGDSYNEDLSHKKDNQSSISAVYDKLNDSHLLSCDKGCLLWERKIISEKIKNITAHQAKELVQYTYSDSLEEITEKIEINAKNGKTCLYLYKPLEAETLKQLKRLGYDIPPLESPTTQNNGLYCIIHWA